MADYDFTLAKQIINSSQNLESASLGMHEDWFWTAEEVWNKMDGFITELNDKALIGGIKGSYWATPVLELEFSDGSRKTIKCFKGMTGDEITRIELEMCWANGVLSGPLQRSRDNIELEDITPDN